MRTDSLTELLELDEVAKRLKCHPKSVGRLIAAGQLRGVRRPITGAKRSKPFVRKGDLDAYIMALPEVQPRISRAAAPDHRRRSKHPKFVPFV